MKTTLIPIGNSRGVRIPKPVIEHCGLEGDVELEMRDRQVVIYSKRKAREGWEKTFKMMSRLGDDALLDAKQKPSAWDEKEWTWS